MKSWFCIVMIVPTSAQRRQNVGVRRRRYPTICRRFLKVVGPASAQHFCPTMSDTNSGPTSDQHWTLFAVLSGQSHFEIHNLNITHAQKNKTGRTQMSPSGVTKDAMKECHFKYISGTNHRRKSNLVPFEPGKHVLSVYDVIF